MQYFVGFIALSIRAASLLLAVCQLAFATAQIIRMSGVVQIDGETVASIPYDLHPGDKIRTGTRAKSIVLFEDGSEVELGADTELLIEETTTRRKSMRLELGLLHAKVKKNSKRRFDVRTPSALTSVRGTEFDIQVYSGGRTRIDLRSGLLGVEDNRGHAVLLRPNESLTVDRRGMSVPKRIPSGFEARKQGIRERMRREMRRDARKNEDFVATLREHKLAEFHQGKILLDARGNRVRVESFFLRPQANQFKLVVLNSRKDRFDYFFYKGTFNKSLPDDLSLAFNDLAGGLGAQPGFYLTGYETGRSNLTDTIYEIAQGGHLVDVNNNADGGDDITSFFNAGTDSFLDAAGRSVFLTLYDRFGLYLNGKLKRGWTGNNLQTYGDAVGSSTTDPISGAVLTASNAYLELSSNLAARTVNTTFPNASDVHQRVFESYSDGAHLTWDNFAINDRGDVAPVSDFAGRTSGSAYQRALLNFNYEQVITATEFQGRKIDLIIGPRLLIQAGLIQ